SPDPGRRDADARGAPAPRGAGAARRPRRRLQDRRPRPRDPRRGQPPREAAERPHHRGRLRALHPDDGAGRARAARRAGRGRDRARDPARHPGLHPRLLPRRRQSTAGLVQAPRRDEAAGGPRAPRRGDARPLRTSAGHRRAPARRDGRAPAHEGARDRGGEAARAASRPEAAPVVDASAGGARRLGSGGVVAGVARARRDARDPDRRARRGPARGGAHRPREPRGPPARSRRSAVRRRGEPALRGGGARRHGARGTRLTRAPDLLLWARAAAQRLRTLPMTASPAGADPRPAPPPEPEPQPVRHRHPVAEEAGAAHHGPTGSLARMALAALGVVYGDIGTSPLYALRECFLGEHPIAITHANVLGVLSLIFWALALVISIKYLTFVMRADNNGEGGILALLSLVKAGEADRTAPATRFGLLLLGLFGAALLYGDGVLTPSISVLSAVEGLGVATHAFHPFIVPITIAILVGLFSVQRHGTAGIGAVFGPLMLLWFLTIAVAGTARIVTQNPEHVSVLNAANPVHGFRFLWEHGWTGFLVLGSVVLVITGGEALYADMGHFGARPIRWAWTAVVFPALLLNYFGQGVLLLERADSLKNPFFELVPDWGL